jgi:hypothetical protein
MVAERSAPRGRGRFTDDEWSAMTAKDDDDQRRLVLIASAFSSHPNTSAVERLLAAINESVALRQDLRMLAASHPHGYTEAEREHVRSVRGAAAQARQRIVSAARELGIVLPD